MRARERERKERRKKERKKKRDRGITRNWGNRERDTGREREREPMY